MTTESFAIRRRAVTHHAEFDKAVREAQAALGGTGEQTPGGRRWEQKSEHVRQIVTEIYGKEAKDAAANAVAELRQLPRLPEMNTRIMVEAWRLLAGLDREAIRRGIEAEEEGAALADDPYAALKAKVQHWSSRGDYSKDRLEFVKAMLMRYCIAIVKANLNFSG